MPHAPPDREPETDRRGRGLLLMLTVLVALIFAAVHRDHQRAGVVSPSEAVGREKVAAPAYAARTAEVRSRMRRAGLA